MGEVRPAICSEYESIGTVQFIWENDTRLEGMEINKQSLSASYYRKNGESKCKMCDCVFERVNYLVCSDLVAVCRKLIPTLLPNQIL